MSGGRAAEASDGAIAFQGKLGANSHVACQEAEPDLTPLPCATFEDALTAVREGSASLGMIPIENTVAGRVADIHHLIPTAGLHIVGEHFLRVRHCLLAPKGTRLEDVREVHSHIHALGQCRNFIRTHGFSPRDRGDTAGAAAEVAERQEAGVAAIATRLAAEIYELDVLAADIEDAEHNTTRFVLLAREPRWPDPDPGQVLTSFLFTVRNIPAALYKALGGFATNGVNMVKLESYVDEGFVQAQFLADVIGHPDEPGVDEALRELRFFCETFRMLGVYPASPFRRRLIKGSA